MKKYIVEKLEDLPKTAADIVKNFDTENLWAFYGKMGSGKTTLIKEICKVKNVTDNVTSPTFSVVNEYHTSTEDIIYHFDFYRIEKTEEVFDMGYEEYFYAGNLCLIEWPELIEPLLPEKYLKIEIDEKENGFRYISCSKIKR
ncbi:MAG: tRNA (adenosine(37)-N6)-threonylcarbamoyltransferase complex ATPase subunit type 1 TsaE [Chlorobi bacterium]|nr:tRNA (adenosine(37)-N6)-threonylcarbamoyltransferase complex ATPase subunit type 1 TsaE [Chlorobiota bacterium]